MKREEKTEKHSASMRHGDGKMEQKGNCLLDKTLLFFGAG